MKDFERWHGLKCAIDADDKIPSFREQEIWWCSVGVNIGVEEDGKNALFERPVLVLKKFSKEGFLGVPITSTRKTGIFYAPIRVNGRNSTVLLSQIRLYDAKRLTRRVEKISDDLFGKILLRFQNLLGFNNIQSPDGAEPCFLRDDRETDIPRVPNGNCASIIPDSAEKSS